MVTGKQAFFAKLLSGFKKNKSYRHDNQLNASTVITSHSNSGISPSSQLIDSAFSASACTSEPAWENELNHANECSQILSHDWYQSLEQLTYVLDKMTSPFCNTNRQLLHQTQEFIEAYLTDWKAQRYDIDTFRKKVKQAHLQYADLIDLKKIVLQVFELEKDLFVYRQTIETLLTKLWDTRPEDQNMDTWKKYLHDYHLSLSEMEAKFKALLESSSPNPDEYTCAVCLSIFTDPLTLPCLHTFCKSCVQHIYCTCRLTQCSSSCHDTANRYTTLEEENPDEMDHDLSWKNYQRRSSYKPRYRSSVLTRSNPFSLSQGQLHPRRFSVSSSRDRGLLSSPLLSATINRNRPRHVQQQHSMNLDPVSLQCDCPLSWSVPEAASCPLCRHPFGPDDCTMATALDNFILFYFPRQDRARERYQAQQRRLKRRSLLLSLSQKWLPSFHPAVPLPPRRRQPPPSSADSHLHGLDHHQLPRTLTMTDSDYHANSSPTPRQGLRESTLSEIRNDLFYFTRRSFII